MAAISYTGKVSRHSPTKQINMKPYNWLSSDSDWLSRDQTGVISGQVQTNGVAQARALVHLYDRQSGERVRSALSDSSGNYSFTGLDKSSSSYYAVAIDPNSTYNAVVYDKLTPA